MVRMHARSTVILLLFVIAVSGVHAQSDTVQMGNEWAVAVKTLFDSEGNLVDIQKYDDSFLQMSNNFQELPWPVKSIFNNQRTQIEMEFTPSQTIRFGLIIQDEKIKSFTLGSLPDATVLISLDTATFEAAGRSQGGFAGGIPQAIKEGKINVKSPDFIHGIMIGIYKLFI